MFLKYIRLHFFPAVKEAPSTRLRIGTIYRSKMSDSPSDAGRLAEKRGG